MKKILIVESKNDKAFFEGLLKYLNVSPSVLLETIEHDITEESIEILGLDDGLFGGQKGLSPKALENAISTITKTLTSNFQLGILIDADKVGISGNIDEDGGIFNRLNLVNKVIKNVFGRELNFTQMSEHISDFKSIEYQTSTFINIQVTIGCYFTNIEGEGFLETLLYELSWKEKAHIAKCLSKWQECYQDKHEAGLIKRNLKNYLDKNFIKTWVEFYKKYDILSKDERRQLDKNTSLEKIMQEGNSRFFNLESKHPDFVKLCHFLKCFDTK
jgi:hypothetical protein